MSDQSSARQQLCNLLAALWQPDAPVLPAAAGWTALLELAVSDGVAPLLRAALDKSGQPVPGEVQQRLDREYFRTAKDQVLRYKALASVIDALDAAGIPVALLKGAALSGPVYGNVALRPMVDLDLLVRPEHWSASTEILLHHGYRAVEASRGPLHLYPPSEQTFVSGTAYGPCIDLHRHIVVTPYYMEKMPVDWLWDNTVPCQAAGRTARVLNLELTLVHLSAHLAFHHRFRGLLWMSDLAFIIGRNRDAIDWDEIAAMAQSAGLVLPVRETLDRLAGCWPSLPLDRPRRRLHALSPTVHERVLFRLLTARPGTPVFNNIVYMAGLPSPRARLGFVWLIMFPPYDFMARRYGITGRRQLPYRYAVRLAIGLLQGMRTLPGVLRAGPDR